jgi:hypothetical protein
MCDPGNPCILQYEAVNTYLSPPKTCPIFDNAVSQWTRVKEAVNG